MNKQISKFALLATLGLSATVALAQVPNNDGYLFDTRGVVAKSGFGLCWKTTRWTPAMAVAECDPELVKKPEPAKPAAPAATPKPAAQKVTLAADALFDFDKAVLRPEGKAKLDDVTGKLKGMKLEVIIAVGHTDRIGSDNYNQKLSEKRAEAVKAYLVGKGVEPNRVYTEGKGEKQPVTGDKCGTSVKKTKKLIECLQPDRRVEIEVIGTK
ncbi:MAG: OmpA family protein [Rhodocyclaceae bacterium]|nr:OmpA family protein [Rhodocyclaceae bacterium]HNQ58515.1 OmpA family protein [Candidatus Desulfobacillus denitrificans]HNT62616.1 OmpA family protein [Candidatus Desulfobacillus denitrificans]